MLCLLIDLIGNTTFFVAGGELDDLVWAPLSAFALLRLFRSDFIAGIQFSKEILPLTDILPVASLAWLLRFGFPGSALGRAVGLGVEDDDDEWLTSPFHRDEQDQEDERQ